MNATETKPARPAGSKPAKPARKPWVRPYHGWVRAVAAALLGPFARWRYGVDTVPFAQQNGRQYLILMNHQTPFDQFFVGLSFQGAVYYMATEDILSLGWVSDLIRFLVAPIPIKKQTTDVQAVRTCLRVAKEGGTIAIAPEGNRTYSGRTEYMNPAIAGLARKLGLPIALYRIEGGYGVSPRWSTVLRKGRMKAYVSRVIEPEEYQNLTAEQLSAMIAEGLYVNEACVDREYHHRQLAEYMERAIYVCPHCGLSTFESHDDLLSCKSCGRQTRYLPTKQLQGVNWDCPFEFVAQWYDYQNDFVNGLDLTALTDEPLYREQANLWLVLLYKRKLPLRKNAAIALYGDRVVIDEGTADALVLPFAEVTAASVLGRNKLNLYHGGQVYQFKGSVRFNALKYVNLYYRYQNMTKGDGNGKFLGL